VQNARLWRMTSCSTLIAGSSRAWSAGEFGHGNQLHSPGEGEGPVVDLHQD